MIKGLIDEGISQRKIAKICKVDRNTLARFLKYELSIRVNQDRYE